MQIMEQVHDLCARHDINYYAIGGTAIGAMRHRGFVPWDDDLDIIMPFHDYHRFLKVCADELDTDRFYLQPEFTRELPKPFTKVRMNNTTYIEAVNPNNGMHQGIFIDVMCLHQAPRIRWLRRLQFFAAKIVSARGLVNVCYRTDSFSKRLFLRLVSGIPETIVFGYIRRFVERWNGKDTGWVGHVYSRAKFSQSYFPEAFVGKPRLVPFEQSCIAVFENVEGFLKTRFGDYMQLPDEQQRRAAQHAELVDLERDYRHYTEQQSSQS